MSISRRFSWLIPVIFIFLLPILAFGVSKEAQKHFDEAMRLKANELSKAIVELKEAISLEPK